MAKVVTAGVDTEVEARATYRYSELAVAPVATPTDFILIQGSASKTGRIKNIKIGGVATAAGDMPVQILRRSAAPTVGGATLNAIVGAKHDVNDAAATCVVSRISAANLTTPGTLVPGILGVDHIQLNTVATGVGAIDTKFEYSDNNDKPLYVRGINDYIAINLNGAAVPAGGVLDYEIEIEEE